MPNQGTVVKKKVPPYPIETQLEAGGLKKTVEIVFLSDDGFIARLKTGGMVFVGEHYQAVFELPVLSKFVNAAVRVVKTYDKSVDPKKHLIERMAEFHFERLTDEHRGRIVSFTTAIGQK